MQNLYVLMHKDELDPDRVKDAVVVVLDVLFATSTIATALHNGAAEVYPVMDPEEAVEVGRELGEGCVLAGEKNALPIDGFSSALPLMLMQVGLEGKRLVYSTTNGTVALRRSQGAKAVLAASLLNGEAVVRYVLSRFTSGPVVVVCSGSVGRFNLEDFYGAGYLVQRLRAAEPDRWDCSDAALAAEALFSHPGLTPEDVLLRSRVGRMVAGWGMEHEVRHSARLGLFDVVPVADGRVLRRAE